MSSELVTSYAIQVLNGLALAMLLFLLAGGLSLIFGMAFVVADFVNLAWGADTRSVAPPDELRGAVPFLGGLSPRYRLFVILAGLLLALALWLIQTRTRI